MGLKTPLCETLGIDVPLIQAPVTGQPQLPLAVAEAGALGMLQLSWTPPEQIPERMAEIRDRAVGINLVLEWPQEERLDLALEHGARIVSFFWGRDLAPLVERVHAAGGIALATVGSAEEARQVEAAGVDVVVAQGWEAGGHVWGEVTTLALVPAVVDAVDVPVVAAGGIADGRGLAAAVVLGAQAAWLGTRFVASAEAPHLYKERIVGAAGTDTVHSTVFGLGWPDAPHRTLLNDATRAAAPRPFPTPASPDELESAALYAGQSSGLVNDVAPAGEIVRRIAAEAEAVLARLRGA